MARLIVKSPYIKCGGGRGAQGYLKYIGTREHVELLPNESPPAQHSDEYMKYIATRPRAERIGSHGLFGDEAHVDLDAVARELEQYTGNVWTHIISLHRDDAVRYGYDHASAWRNLLLTHRNEIAAAMHIPPKDFRWYAAFHDEGDHPHVHMMAWSVKPGQAYLNREGIRQIRSALTNDVFRHELTEVLEQKSASRDALVQEAREALREVTEQLRQGICNYPGMEQKLWTLSMELGSVKGKKSYGYLPKRLKSQVDGIVDAMERLPAVSQAYDRWLELRRQVDGFYKDEQRKRKKLSEEKEFRAIKNAVIREAEQLRLNVPTFEDLDFEKEDEHWNSSYASPDFWELYETVRDIYADGGTREAAVMELETLAEQGDADAQYTMGRLYREGPIPIPDWRKACSYREKAARRGLPEAQYELGKLLLSDDVEVRNPALGMRWLEFASGNGDAYAAYRAGKEYLCGQTVERDERKAEQFFRRAADLGNQYGQYMLGKLCLEQGDTEQGLEWMWRSASQGNAYAQIFLDRKDTLNPPSVMLSTSRLLHHMANIFRDSAPQDATGQKLQISRKRLQELIRLKGRKAAMEYARSQEEYSGPKMSAPW